MTKLRQPPTVTCCVCGNQVTKRQSIFIGRGRACRAHDEAVVYLQEQEAEKQIRRGNDALMVMMGTEMIRCWHTIRGISVHSLLFNIRPAYAKSKRLDLWEKIGDEVRKNPTLTESEISGAIATLALNRDFFSAGA